MTHPLIDRPTAEFGWSDLQGAEDFEAHLARPGTHMVFVPGDVARNLETPDVAVIAPELLAAFGGRFDGAVAVGEADTAARAAAGAHKTPSLLFFRDGLAIGAIPKVRDWSDYMDRIAQILAHPVAAE